MQDGRGHVRGVTLSLRAALILMAGLALALALAVAVAAPAMAAPPSARVWVTTPDGALKLSNRGSAEFRPGGSQNLTISVDPSRSYQTMDGFGASITDSSAHVLYRLDRRHRDATMRRLFSPSDGDGLSFLRQPMGASDFVAGDFYTYDDLPAGKTDYDMRHFSIAHDRAQILPLLRQALELNPRLKVIGYPWSPPAWMKTNGSLIGGRLIDDPRIYAAYARYFVEFVQAYEHAGVPVYAMTVQNEPQNRNPSGYPGMDLPVAQEAKLIAALGPAFRDAGIDTKIFGYDHNWSMHPGDIDVDPARRGARDGVPDRPARRAAPARWSPAPPSTATPATRAARPRCTERSRTRASGSRSARARTAPTDPPAQVFSDTLKWHTRNLVLGVTRNWGKTVVNWNLALDPTGGPHNGGCDTCTGVVTVGPGSTVTRNAEYYTLGHLARFVQPGARRIASTSFGTTGWNGQIMDVAFRNPDGSTALVVHNENDDPRRFAVAAGRPLVRLHAAGRRAGHVHLAGVARARRRPGSARRRPDERHGLARRRRRNAVDDDATTRWTTAPPSSPASGSRSTWAARRGSAGSSSTRVPTSRRLPASNTLLKSSSREEETHCLTTMRDPLPEDKTAGVIREDRPLRRPRY